MIQNKIARVFNAYDGHEAARKLAELNGRIVTAEGELNALHEELRSVDLELHESKEVLAEVEERLKSLGAIDPEELQRAQDTRSKLAETKARLEAVARFLARSSGVILDYCCDVAASESVLRQIDI